MALYHHNLLSEQNFGFNKLFYNYFFFAENESTSNKLNYFNSITFSSSSLMVEFFRQLNKKGRQEIEKCLGTVIVH